jgi:hypothetical protein
LNFFSPERDEDQLFNPGEQPFISNGNLFLTKKPPFHRLKTVVKKRRQITVIMTVPPVLKPHGVIFMEPGFVSCRLIRPVIPKSLLVKLICG